MLKLCACVVDYLLQDREVIGHFIVIFNTPTLVSEYALVAMSLPYTQTETSALISPPFPLQADKCVTVTLIRGLHEIEVQVIIIKLRSSSKKT